MSKRIIFLLVGFLLLVVGCGEQAAAKDAAAGDALVQASVVSDTAVVEAAPLVAQGNQIEAAAVIEPLRWAELSFDEAGNVAEVLVAPGEHVQAGAPLVRLDTSALELSLQIAQQEVLAKEAANRQAALQNADQVAQAEIDLKIAQLELEELETHDPSTDVSTAQSALDQLELRLSQLQAQDPTPAVTAAQVQVTRAQGAYDYWLNEYNKSLDRPWEPQDLRDQYYGTLQQADFDLQVVRTELDTALDAKQAHDIELQILAVQIKDARGQVEAAIQAAGSFTITLDIQAARVDAAQLDLENLRTEGLQVTAPDGELSEAGVRLEQAKLAVEQLELQIEQSVLRAPFAGIVTSVPVGAGDQIDAHQVLVVLATLDQLETLTTDLSELDVARVKVGQPATVTIDALPGRVFAGVVRHIALQSELVNDKVIYAVRISLSDGPSLSDLRWGMNALVEIETD